MKVRLAGDILHPPRSEATSTLPSAGEFRRHVEVLDVEGRRRQVKRRINEAEAVVVRRIFDLCAAGQGGRRFMPARESTHVVRSWGGHGSAGNPLLA